MRILFLAALVAISAIGVVYAKHRARVLFVEVQKLEQEIEALQTEWGQLRLEQNTWAEHGRIERIARSRLGMEMPERKSIVYLKP
ncbi:MAG TPA: cell division protein FtsL [Methylococcaceae bacterium]|nr:cell division protein FtsL [Methylococcaceae bacterium]